MHADEEEQNVGLCESKNDVTNKKLRPPKWFKTWGFLRYPAESVHS